MSNVYNKPGFGIAGWGSPEFADTGEYLEGQGFEPTYRGEDELGYYQDFYDSPEQKGFRMIPLYEAAIRNLNLLESQAGEGLMGLGKSTRADLFKRNLAFYGGTDSSIGKKDIYDKVKEGIDIERMNIKSKADDMSSGWDSYLTSQLQSLLGLQSQRRSALDEEYEGEVWDAAPLFVKLGGSLHGWDSQQIASATNVWEKDRQKIPRFLRPPKKLRDIFR
tara:strand:- start:1271 stop:1930 length:660 start_codon:yes stop_codon:yes gene_type:complete